MAGGVPDFPLPVRVEYQSDSSLKTAFLADIDALIVGGKTKFQQFSSDVGKQLTAALSINRNSFNALDLGTDKVQADAQAHRKRADAAREVAQAIAVVMGQQKSYNDATARQISDLRKLAMEEEQAAAAALARARALSQVQQVMNQRATARNNPDLTFGLDRLMKGAASIDRAAVSGTTLENVLGRVANKGKDVVDAMRQAELQAAQAVAAVEAVSGRGRFSGTRNFVDQYVQGRQAAEGLVTASVTLETVLGRVAGKSREVAEALRQADERAARVSAAQVAGSVRGPSNRDFGVDAILAGKAAIDSAALSGATLESVLGRVATKGREIQAALQAATAGRERDMAMASAAAAGYAKDLELVRRAIDPTRVAQQQLDAELARAEAALSRGSISMREYGTAVNVAADKYSMMVTGAREGTSANHMMVNSTRALRVAMLQSGQQLQDVAISLYSGQRAGVVFAQQLPQLAFALSGLEGSANKTHDRIGRFATFLSGPWGLAVGLAVGFAGQLITEYLGLGKEAEEANKKTYDFSRTIDVLALSAKESANAMEQLASATRSAIQAQGDFLESQLETANKAVSDLEARIAANQQALQRAKNEAGTFTADPTEVARRIGRVSGLRDAISSDRTALESARQAQANAQIAFSQRSVIDSMDEAAAATTRYNEAVGKLNKRYEDAVKLRAKDPLADATNSGLMTKQEYDREFARLTAEKNRATEAARKSSSTDRGAREMAAFGNPLPGYRISSGYGARTAPTAGASKNHLGLDYAAPIGTPVLAAMDGIVKFAAAVNGYGNQIELNHGAGTATRYSHLSQFSVGEGEAVRKGQKIGEVGRTGVATGPHLHYEVLVNGKKVDPSKGSFPIDATKVAEAAQRSGDTLADFGNRASQSIAQITSQFDEQPRLIDQVARATRELDSIMAKLKDETPEGWQQMVADAQAARDLAANAVNSEIAKMKAASDEQYKVQTLIVSGREREAAAVSAVYAAHQRLGDILPEQEAEVRRIAEAEYDRAEAIKLATEMQSYYLDATRSVRSEVEAILAGQGKLSNLKQVFQRLRGQVLAEQLFGDVFRDLDKWVKEKTGIGSSVDRLGKEVDRSSSELARLSDAVATTADALGGRGGQSAPAVDAAWSSFLGDFDAALSRYSPANDNGQPIVVRAETVRTRATRTVNDLSPNEYFSYMSQQLGKAFSTSLNSAFGTSFFSKFDDIFSGAFEGYMMAGGPGAIVGGLKNINGLPAKLDQLFGKGKLASEFDEAFGMSGLDKAFGGMKAGSRVAGIAGAFGVNLSNSGSQIGGALGGLLKGIPGGDIIGAIAGGIISKLIGGTKRGSATIGGVNGSLGITGTRGNSSSFIDASSAAGEGVIANVQRIADAFGATVNAALGSVSIGIRDGKYRVDSSGQGVTRTSRGAVDFGKDGAQAAAMYATMDLIKDGVITGLRAGTQLLLKNAKDLESGLQKALDFEGVFNQLKAIQDPVGSALDTLDKEFKRLKLVFDEAGATTAEYADLEKLYNLKRADAIKAAQQQLTGSLQGLLGDLTTGDSGQSLRSRQAAAYEAYNPLKARVQAGDATAYDDFVTASQTLLGIQRELYGSQQGYFDLFNEIKSLTQAALDRENTRANDAIARDTPFSSSAVPSNDNAAVVDAVNNQTDALTAQLTAVNDNLGSVIEQLIAIGAFNPSMINFQGAF